jgi:hypothetical protein
MMQTVDRGELPGDRAFARGGWTVDRNDHRRRPFAAARCACRKRE